MNSQPQREMGWVSDSLSVSVKVYANSLHSFLQLCLPHRTVEYGKLKVYVWRGLLKLHLIAEHMLSMSQQQQDNGVLVHI